MCSPKTVKASQGIRRLESGGSFRGPSEEKYFKAAMRTTTGMLKLMEEGVRREAIRVVRTVIP